MTDRAKPKVYAIVPVFNRPRFTTSCIERLLSQDYPNLKIVISDGKSTDGSPEFLKRWYGNRIVLLQACKEQWWSGSMAIGMDYVLGREPRDTDFILMMNDDTEFDSDYVSTLVSEAEKYRSVIGSMTLDSQDRKKILDAGVHIEWENYDFRVKTGIAPGEECDDSVDVLPGRGTLVPVGAIRKVGPVDFRRFPHYIADYEFTARIKRAGYKLVVSFRARIYSHSDATGLRPGVGHRRTWSQIWKLKASRRSMNNIVDHLRFILSCSPNESRKKALGKLFFRRLRNA